MRFPPASDRLARVTPPASSLPTGVRRGAVAVFALLAACGAAGGAVAQSERQTFDIPAQDAASALVRLCLIADCELAFMPGADPAVRTRPVSGSMSWRTAVQRMLAGTDLRYRFVGARGVRIWAEPRAAERPAPAPVEAAELEAIEVVGRLSQQIEESLRRKRQADVISDSASANRLGDLPAANLAEALQRVPGVAIEREVGEGQFVSVRGLGPLFQSVTLNGAPVAFNENIRNSTQSGRQFRFRALSADLLSGAQLTKSATPDMVDGGIGSNIDIETVGGLDGDPFLSARVGLGIEARTEHAAPDLSLAGRWVSADGDRGVVAGVSQDQRLVLYDRFQIQRYKDLPVDGRTLSVPNDVRTTVEREDRLRRSAFLGADWRVSQDLSLDLDALVSTFDNAIEEDRLVFSLGERLQTPGVAVTEREGVVTGAVVRDGKIDNNTEVSDQSHLNTIVSAGAAIRMADWRLTPRISVSAARSRLDTPLERMSSSVEGGVGYVFDLGDAGGSRNAERLTTDVDLRDAGRLKPERLGVRAIASEDRDTTALFDAERVLDWRMGGALRVSGLRIGAQVSDRSRDYQRRDREATLRPVADTAAFYGRTTAPDVFQDLIAQAPGPWIAADFARFAEAYHLPGEAAGVIVQPGDLTPTGADLQNSYYVSERVAAAYVRLDVDGQIGATPVFGNLGLRAVETRTRVDGSLLGMSPAGEAEVRSVVHQGSDRALLPSLNLALDLDEHRMLRLAVSRTLTRPSLADVRSATVPASTLVSSIYDRGQAEIDDPSPGSIFTGVGGNPDLTPYLATNLDLSWEWTTRQGALSVALFHKRIDDFILTVAAPETLTFETRDGPPVEAQVMMSRPRNVGRAEVTGLEIGLHRRLASGLGLWASATWTDSRALDLTDDRSSRLTGVSDFAYSINPFFERGPLAVNLSWSWRSTFRSEADMQGGGVSEFVVAPAGYLDAQASYDLNDTLQVIASASNLTDVTDLSYDGDRTRLLQLGRVGRAFTLSLRWTL